MRLFLLIPVAALLAVLIPICVVQVMYLAALRLRAKDTEALEFFREELADTLSYKLEEGALAFSLAKHSLIVLITVFLAGLADTVESPGWLGLLQTFAFAWFAMIVFSHLVPHLLYRKTSGHWLKAFLPLLLVVKTALRPLVATLEFLESLAELSQPEESREAVPTTQENVEALIDAGTEGGLIEEDDRKLIRSVVEFGDKTVREVMTPRPEIVAISRDASFDQLRALLIREEYSRIPVYLDSIDHVVGYVHVRDILKQDLIPTNRRSVQAVLRPILYVPETKSVSVLFREMQAAGQHIAMVADEYGNTAGLVTMEDVVEVILGDIRDEHEPPRDFVEDADGCFVVSGNYDLDRLAELTGFRPAEPPDSATVGGLVSEWLGRVPQAGETVERDGLRVEVLAADDRRVSQVRVAAIQAAPPQAPGTEPEVPEGERGSENVRNEKAG